MSATKQQPSSAKKTSTKEEIRFPLKKVSYLDIGGMETQIELLKDLVATPLKESQLLESLGLHLPRGILLYGPPGTGKSLLARAVISESNVHSLSVSTLDALSSPAGAGAGGDVESHLVRTFTEAKENAPSIILVDDLETICPKYESGHMTLQESKAVGTLVNLIDTLEDAKAPVLILATCVKPDQIHHSLRRPGRFDKEIEIPVPTSSERLEILKKLVSKLKKCGLTDKEMISIAARLHGFVGSDIAALCSEAGVNTIRRYSKGREGNVDVTDISISYDDFLRALPMIKPSALREVQIEVPKVRWDDIGGMKDTKLRLRQSVEWPLQHWEAFERLGIHPPRGILLFGPPGCSKTLIARALATEAGLNFLAVKGPELYSKWVGESERALREIFTRARKSAPSIIFIDEIDAIATSRGSAKGGGNVGDRVLATFLNEMDGIESLQNVIIVAATNRPDVIDKALMRPGRLDRIIYVPLPNADTRKDILNVRFRETKVAPDVNMQDLVDLTEGFSGAELTALCQEAALAALEEDLDAVEVHTRHFRKALFTVKPRTTAESVRFYENFNKMGASVLNDQKS